MKTLIVNTIFLFSLSVFSQADSVYSINEFDRYAFLNGNFTKTEYYDIGRVSKCHVEVLRFTDLNSKNEFYRVVLQIGYSVNFDYTLNASSVILDSTDITEVLNALKVMSEATATIPDAYTEIIYSNNKDLWISMFFDQTSWNFEIVVSTTQNSTEYLKPVEFSDFSQYLKDSQSKIAELKKGNH